MAPINDRLRENPRLQRMPKDEREWVHFINEMSKWVIKIAKLGDGTLVTSSDTTISGLDEMPGQIASERSLLMINVGNAPSTQSAVPLTSSDAGATATITVAAHNLETPSGDIAYNAGSITGLTHETKYYVYTDDGDYSGGAVTYVASTDPSDVVGATGRYYVGSITTADTDSSGNISNVVKGSSTTITTSAAHGLTTGETVTITNIVDDGPDGDLESALNGNSYSITVTSTTEFTVPEDTSGLTNTYVSGGDWSYTAPATSGSGGGVRGVLD